MPISINHMRRFYLYRVKHGKRFRKNYGTGWKKYIILHISQNWDRFWPIAIQNLPNAHLSTGLLPDT